MLACMQAASFFFPFFTFYFRVRWTVKVKGVFWLEIPPKKYSERTVRTYAVVSASLGKDACLVSTHYFSFRSLYIFACLCEGHYPVTSTATNLLLAGTRRTNQRCTMLSKRKQPCSTVPFHSRSHAGSIVFDAENVL